ncbi:hypothetical protein, partial [Mesorhizobium sp. A556]
SGCELWRMGVRSGMVSNPQDPRELAASALCRRHGLPEDTKYDGEPTWVSFLRDVDTVLEAVGWEPEEPKATT